MTVFPSLKVFSLAFTLEASLPSYRPRVVVEGQAVAAEGGSRRLPPDMTSVADIYWREYDYRWTVTKTRDKRTCRRGGWGGKGRPESREQLKERSAKG